MTPPRRLWLPGLLPMTRLGRDRRGVSAVEFAFVLPMLVLIYVAGYQLSDAIAANRKVTIATRAIADLTTQYVTVTDTSLDTILAASQQIMTPYSAANATAIVSEISIDKDRNATVTWSRPLNGAALIVGAPYTLPDNIRLANTSLIIATMDYNYVPKIASKMIGTIPMRDQIIMSPRRSADIPKI